MALVQNKGYLFSLWCDHLMKWDMVDGRKGLVTDERRGFLGDHDRRVAAGYIGGAAVGDKCLAHTGDSRQKILAGARSNYNAKEWRALEICSRRRAIAVGMCMPIGWQ
jgi:hypothetical protein